MTASLAEVPDAYRSSATSTQPGRFAGARFWKIASCVDALDEPFQDHRAPGDAAQRTVGDGQVVADQVEFGVAGSPVLTWKDHLVGMGDLDLVSAHLQ